MARLALRTTLIAAIVGRATAFIERDKERTRARAYEWRGACAAHDVDWRDRRTRRGFHRAAQGAHSGARIRMARACAAHDVDRRDCRTRRGFHRAAQGAHSAARKRTARLALRTTSIGAIVGRGHGITQARYREYQHAA
ncbi:hypothetical protein [Caballeronia sp. BCC1704]|uniref:hypothetical protein n=1 Tax=Caballeronia sp. BCC1704 TaxID=2676300 RepID=UPI00158E84CB|nr:hypothetical protein [Caballeronia sp. BCC1704]